jgi:hypothetical protein
LARLPFPPRPYRHAWLIAWATTVLGIGLATVPHWGGRYDASLAIYTLTLVAIIWYTYFTYRSVNPYHPTVVRASLSGLLHPLAIDLSPQVRNDSPNDIAVQIVLDVWIDGKPHDLDAFYSGGMVIPIESQDGFAGGLRLQLSLPPGEKANIYGEVTRAPYERLAARLVVFWRDHHGESGSVPTKYFAARLADSPAVGPVLGPDNINALFGAFKPPLKTAPLPWA